MNGLKSFKMVVEQFCEKKKKILFEHRIDFHHEPTQARASRSLTSHFSETIKDTNVKF